MVIKLLDYLPLPSFVMQDGYIIKANAKMALLTESSLEDLANLPFGEFIHPTERARVTQELIDFQSNRDFTKQIEFIAVSRNGRKLYLQCTFSPFDCAKLVGQINDLTEQKLSEQALNLHSRKL